MFSAFQYRQLLILVLMYRHAYSDYVSHILNRSPSKAAYSFTKAARFPEPKDDSPPIQQPYLSANGFDYSDGARHIPERPTFHRTSYQINYHKLGKEQGRSPSKSPLRAHNRYDNLANKGYEQKKQQTIRKSSKSKINTDRKSTSKSPTREKGKKHSPTKSYTEKEDHSAKKRTLNGYYPIGYELSPTGTYYISSIKNTPAHSFGRSEQRYQYVPKSEDEIGPAFYHPFSEFGHPKN